LKNIIRQMRAWMGKTPNHSAENSSFSPPHPRVEFILTYEDFPLGTLSLTNSIWQWKYSDQFRAQTDIVPLIEFPDVNATYRTEELWPFFATRAPSLKRPDILQIIEREHIDQADEVALLKRFGKRTIANPFELSAA